VLLLTVMMLATSLELTDPLKGLLKDTAKRFKGTERRQFMAQVVQWLEQHWRGSLLNSVETVICFAESLTFKGKQPTVNLVKQTYNIGVKLTQKAMAELEKALCRLPYLEKWFVEICPTLP